MWNEKLKRLRKNEKKQTITISIAAGNYDSEIIIDLINRTIQDFRVRYQESSIGFENLAYLQSIENKCNKFFDFITLWIASYGEGGPQENTCIYALEYMNMRVWI